MDRSVTTAAATRVRVRPITFERKRDRQQFIDFPYAFYRDDYPAWIPPLRQEAAKKADPRQNAFFEHGRIQSFLAEDAAGTVRGRIAAIVNELHLQTYGDGAGFFGFFECVEQYEVAEALLEAAAAWLRAQGLTEVRGPTNPSFNEEAGLLVDGFDREPSIMMPYNPPYYATFLERCCFERIMTMWAYYVHKKYVRPERLRRGVELVRRRNPGLTLRTVDLSRFDEEAAAILRIYNAGWAGNWGFVPTTEAEFNQLAKDLRQIVDPSIVFLVEDEGEPVAFSIALPNLNQALRHVSDGRLFPLGLPKLLAYSKFGGIYECRMPLMGVLPAYQGRGLDALLVLATIDNGPPNGYDACEMSWVLDTNARLKNAMGPLGAVVDKEYGFYAKPL